MLSGDVRLAGRTYLWMFPIYGLAIFFEYVHDRIWKKHWIIRGFIWLCLIWLIEYTTGGIIRLATGVCPWDYSGNLFSVNGLIRLDMAPAWFAVGLIFEKVHFILDERQIIKRTQL